MRTTDSLCCTPETNNTVNQLHSKKVKKIEGKITVLTNYYHRLSRLKNNTNRKKNLDFPPLFTGKRQQHLPMGMGWWRVWNWVWVSFLSLVTSFTSQAREGWSTWSLFVLNLLYWSIVNFKCCINFCCTAKCFSYTYVYICMCIYIYVYIYICAFFTFFSIMVIIGYWIYFLILSKDLLFIYSLYNTLYLLIPNSQSIPPSPSSPLSGTSLFYIRFILMILIHSTINFWLPLCPRLKRGNKHKNEQHNPCRQF